MSENQGVGLYGKTPEVEIVRPIQTGYVRFKHRKEERVAWFRIYREGTDEELHTEEGFAETNIIRMAVLDWLHNNASCLIWSQIIEDPLAAREPNSPREIIVYYQLQL